MSDGSTWKDALVARYKHLFGRGGFPTVGDGWCDLLERCLSRIELSRGRGQVQIVQIKEKFGTLRVYWGGEKLSDAAIARIEEAIELAEMRSACTCEECGAEGRLYNRGGWYLTRCPEHAQGEPVNVKVGTEKMRIVTKYIGDKRITSAWRYDRELDVLVPAPVPKDVADE